uniref:Uncharacterized protein n=1 Tax=Quercus lobata TaxID=97700 RepID=A0A7N2MI57_QUELO
MDQAVVELLIENIISVLSNDASLLWGARDAIEDIKDELISMRSFLVDADRTGVRREGEKTWVATVRDWAYDVEDIIDEYMYHMNHQQIGGQSSWNLHHTINFPKNLWVRRQTATKIQKINEKIKGAIPERKQRYGIDHIEGTGSKDNQKWVVRHAESSLFFKEDELVGIEKKRQSLMKWLMDGEPHLTVISIVGMGGSGKTTLAANTYNNDDVKKHFDCCAWITISQAYELEDVLRSLIMEFHESRKETNPADLNSMSYRLLVKTLVNYLGEKRYLLVLDDVWDTNLLDEIKVSLRDSCLGSRIILTTRKEDVACYHLGEDHEIRRKRLIKLWMAEGFVEQDKRSMPEEVAESYLLELIFRSMLQVVKRNDSGRPKRCKMHDILRELALSISEREKIGVVHVRREEMTECEARRISIHKTDGEVKSFTRMPKLRSFLVFNKMLKTLPFGSKMLRVLDLEDAPIDDLPDELFKLFNLRYLNLRGTLVKELPKSVGRLRNLQTLDIRDTKLEIRSMTQLTTIALSNVKAADEMDLCDSIHNMKLMRYLCIVVTNAEETLRMDALSSPPTNLQKLVLVGKLEKVPQWFHSLQSLTYLYLHWSRLEEDLLPHIAALPHLGHLSLFYVYVGKQLCFSTGFLKLTKLRICNFPQLNEIIIEKGVMPNLKSLEIYSCMELKAAPKGIENLQNLQLLHLQSVSMELQNRIHSVDFPKVQHIPKIYIL